MNSQYFLSLAKQNGYGNATKERLWGTVTENERLKIFKSLLSLRWVREICNFEDDFTCQPRDYSDEYQRLAETWSKETSLDEVPMMIALFVFFSFDGRTFSQKVIANEAERFFWHQKGTFVE